MRMRAPGCFRGPNAGILEEEALQLICFVRSTGAGPAAARTRARPALCLALCQPGDERAAVRCQESAWLSRPSLRQGLQGEVRLHFCLLFFVGSRFLLAVSSSRCVLF